MKSPFLLPALIASLGLMQDGRVTAQTFTTLHSFTHGEGSQSELILSGNTLYGTTRSGGSSGNGAVFGVNTDGTGFTNLYSFTSGSDGAEPIAGLVLVSNTLYGTTAFGGSPGPGTVFKVNTNGADFTTLHSFAFNATNGTSDGLYPVSALILSGNTLYGTALLGGSSNSGTVFKVNTKATGFTTLHNFTAGSGSSPNVINSDGAYLRAGLILSGNTLYGTACQGGSSGAGTVFAVNTNGNGFTNLHIFTGGSGGANPDARLILLGNTLYGTARNGGSSSNGTVFAINIDGTGFTTLHSFTGISDGANPYAGLILSGNTLYGTAFAGGSSDAGTVFAVNTDGTGFTNLHSFTALLNSTNSDGAYPYAGLILSGNTLYGTTIGGGSNGGTVFSIALPPPPLTISRSATHVILTWPNYAPGVTLQSTTNLVSPATWSNVVTIPSDNGTNRKVIVNPPTGNRFYRLAHP